MTDDDKDEERFVTVGSDLLGTDFGCRFHLAR